MWHFPTTRPADFDYRCLQKHMTSQSNFRLMIYCRKLNSVNNKTEVSVLFFNKFKGVSNIKNEMEI